MEKNLWLPFPPMFMFFLGPQRGRIFLISYEETPSFFYSFPFWALMGQRDEQKKKEHSRTG